MARFGRNSRWGLAALGAVIVVISSVALVRHWSETGSVSSVVVVWVVGLLIVSVALGGRAPRG